MSWSESSLISEQPRSDRSGSSSGSGGSERARETERPRDAHFSHGADGRSQTEHTAFHTPDPSFHTLSQHDTRAPSQSMPPSVALTAMWSRDVGSDVEARRLRQVSLSLSLSLSELHTALLVHLEIAVRALTVNIVATADDRAASPAEIDLAAHYFASISHDAVVGCNTS